jgi:hypothetical protein
VDSGLSWILDETKSIAVSLALLVNSLVQCKMSMIDPPVGGDPLIDEYFGLPSM